MLQINLWQDFGDNRFFLIDRKAKNMQYFIQVTKALEMVAENSGKSDAPATNKNKSTSEKTPKNATPVSANSNSSDLKGIPQSLLERVSYKT